MRKIRSRWMVYSKKADFYGIGERLGIDPVVVRILTNRGLNEEGMKSFLNPRKEDFHKATLMKGMKEAVLVLKEAIREEKSIRIIGDYDVDGVFSTYILTEGLKRLGARASYEIPHRISDGYGINSRLVLKAKDDGADIILTCDNGIKAISEVKLAKELGMKVVVTDHHELDFDLDENGEKIYILPEADAVINPHQPGCAYPFKSICGAVVAWRLIEAMYEDCGIMKEADDFLPFAAFATLSDVMPLMDENRSMVYYGLLELAETKNPGMRSLIEKTELSGKKINAFDVGFVLGPCFNAAGRLDSAARAEELLLEDDALMASKKAESLKNLNEQRKKMTEEGFLAAEEEIQTKNLIKDRVLVVYIPSLHESIAGIVAGRLKERYFRPVYVLTDGASSVKGSGRSIPAYSMAEKLHDVSDILIRYGGHPMAAGLSIAKEHVDEFRERLNKNSGLSDEDLVPTVWIDAAMPLGYITKQLVNQLNELEPFGEGNEKPLFATKDIAPYSARFIGKEGQYIKFDLPKNKTEHIEALYFGDAGQMIEELKERYGADEIKKMMTGKPSKVRLAFSYYPGLNVYRGRESLQIIIEDYR